MSCSRGIQPQPEGGGDLQITAKDLASALEGGAGPVLLQVIDFGIARWRGACGVETQPGVILGTRRRWLSR